MSNAAAKPKRVSRRVVRVWAWTVGALSFLSPWALLGLWPKPAFSAAAAPTSTTTRPQRPVVVVVTKKIVYTKSPTTSVSSSGPVHYVSAPSAPSVATSCGTHAC